LNFWSSGLLKFSAKVRFRLRQVSLQRPYVAILCCLLWRLQSLLTNNLICEPYPVRWPAIGSFRWCEMQYRLIRTVNKQITHRSCCCCHPLYPSPYWCQLMASFPTHCRVRRKDFWINKQYKKNWSWLIKNGSISSRVSRFIFFSLLRCDIVWCGSWL
jgi:hypothetical protein